MVWSKCLPDAASYTSVIAAFARAGGLACLSRVLAPIQSARCQILNMCSNFTDQMRDLLTGAFAGLSKFSLNASGEGPLDRNEQ